MAETIDTAAAVLTRLAPDLLLIRFKGGIGVEAEHADEIVSAATDLFRGAVHANLVDVREMMFIDQSARDRFAQQERAALSGIAVLVDSGLRSTMANLYMSVSRPKIPTRLFTSESEARTWLNQRTRSHRSSLPPS